MNYVATKRRFEGIGENHGFSSCREYYIGSGSLLLVLLWGNQHLRDKYRYGRQDVDELRPHCGLVHCLLYTKLFLVVLLALSCLGTSGVKGEKITWAKIGTVLAIGFVLFFLNWWILELSLSVTTNTILYVCTTSAGYVCLLMGGLWMSRLLKHNLMADVFNNENENFMQETRLLEASIR